MDNNIKDFRSSGTLLRFIELLMYIYIIFVFFPADLIGINLKFFYLSFDRIILLVLLAFYLFGNNGLIIFSKCKNCRFSQKFLLFWLCYAMCTLLWAKDVKNFIRNFYFIFVGFFLAMIFVDMFKTQKDILRIIGILRIPIWFIVILGIYESFTGNYLFLTGQKNIEVYSRINYVGLHTPVAMAGNVNNYALQLLLGMCVFYICIMTGKRLIFKIMDLIGMMVCGMLVIVSGSRGAMLGVILFLGFLSVYSRKMRLILIICLVILLMFNGDKIVNAIVSNLQTLSIDDMKSMRGDESNSIRANLIINGLIFLVNTYGIGVGMGQIENWMQTKAVYATRNIYNIHNWWCELLVSYGVVFFSIYLLFYYKLYKSQIERLHAKDKIAVETSKGIAAFLVGFIIAGVSPSSCMSLEWLWMFWALIIAWQGINVEGGELIIR